MYAFIPVGEHTFMNSLSICVFYWKNPQWMSLPVVSTGVYKNTQFLKFHQTGNKLSFQLSCISLWRERRGSHQGMSLPILVHLLFVMKKPTTGSVTAPQTLPMNSTMEAWKALICGAQQGHAGTHRHTFPYQLIFSSVKVASSALTWATSSR